MTRQRLFLSEFTFMSFLLSMLSCLTLDAECFIYLDTLTCLISGGRGGSLIGNSKKFDPRTLLGPPGGLLLTQFKSNGILISTRKMTGQTIFWTKENDGKVFFLMKNWRDKQFFGGGKTPSAQPINFSPSLRGLKLLIRLRGSEILLAGRKGYEIQLTGLKGSETLKTGYNEYNKRVTGVQEIIP